ncbi:hypothetical protein EJ04DRAFT_263446 [Polyplosphaeria fusca]|uniref:Uncharacterized protein n=1 Tax=Polyplosphaeria fusca TaxID=682080 RepID=A0A9P4V6N6_9PLEO|nr:hypothetical protein EJ04DRAFT_263446 [Polyplosphaeria fusca]
MPPADYWDEEDEWYHRDSFSGARHVYPPPMGRRSDFLAPERTSRSSGLHRTRSQGHSPAPNVYVYANADSSPRMDQRSPAPPPPPPPPPRAEPQVRGRVRGRADEWALEDEIDQLRHELRKNRRSRSRSRSRSAHRHHHYEEDMAGHAYDKWQLERANEQLKEAENRAALEKREELLKRKMELQYLKNKQEREEEEERIKLEEARLKKDFELKIEKENHKKLLDAQAKADERKRIIQENTAKLEREAREEKEARDQAVAEYRRKQMEADAKAKEERDRVIADFKRKEFDDAQKAKKAREDLLAQIAIEDQKRKEEEKRAYDAFVLKQKQKEQEEKEKREKEEAALEEQMRKRLAVFGFQENQIQAMIKPEEQPKIQQGMTPNNPLRLTQQPTYVKVHKDHLSIETLNYYEIPYEYDRSDPDFLIVMREMDQRETEILFEHTRRLRSRGGSRLLIEERRDHGKPDYAWVRKKRSVSRSPSRRRSSPKRVVGIKEMFY